jgi:hypothetical protein
MANIQAAGQSAEPETGERPLAVNGDRGAGGSPMGRVYRETTPAMVARVTAALDDRIGRALAVAAYLLRDGRVSRVVDGGEAR